MKNFFSGLAIIGASAFSVVFYIVSAGLPLFLMYLAARALLKYLEM